ncbi:MAG: hypothetical protein RL684_2946 [Pseudomonadota bacterium]|jgi:hypothetical protein
MDNNFSALLLNESGLRAGRSGLEIDVRLPWYRSMPLSVVEVASLAIDGQPVEPASIAFEINGKSFALAQLPEQVGEFWFVLDDAVLRVAGVPVRAGETHSVELQLNLYPPYIPHLTWVTRAKKSARVQPAAGERT